MTALPGRAIRRVESLPAEEQDAIAAQIFEIIEDEEKWEQSLRAEPAALHALADEALEAHRLGLSRPLDELIG